MLIVVSGLPGVGKTTIARELARSLPAVYVRIDSIEQALRNCGVSVEGEGYAVAHAVAGDNLRIGQTVEVVCSDQAEHRRRVESRVADTAGHRVPTWQDVMERDYRVWDRQPLVIDSLASAFWVCLTRLQTQIHSADAQQHCAESRECAASWRCATVR